MTVGDAADTVFGFSQAAGDSILLNGASSVGAVVASAQTVNGDTTVTFGDGSKLTLLGISHVDSSGRVGSGAPTARRRSQRSISSFSPRRTGRYATA